MKSKRLTTTRTVAMAAAVLASAGMAASLLPAAAAPSASPASASIIVHSAKVDRLLSKMTLDEKLTLLTGGDEPASKTYAAGYLPGIARLGIPAIRLADGPPGVATREVSTGMTSTMGLAATFDTSLAKSNGKVIGRDGKALGQDVVLEPFVNIDRDPLTGRGWNTFGEDPLLTGAMGSAEIKGIQSQGVMAQVKHYIAYDGASGNVVVDEQTLHEIYVKPFEDAVKAGVSSVMCSYNKINGKYACGNADVLNGILKTQLGFKGFVTSDWGANHDTSFLSAGLDMEMPGGGLGGFMTPYFARAEVKAALDAGTVKVSDVDAAVSRLLYQYEKFGLLNSSDKVTIKKEHTTANARVVRETAAKSAVLLKNEGDILPLDKQSLSSLALIGPGAGQTIATGGEGESSTGLANRWVGTVKTLKEAKPSAHITYAVGDDLTGVAIPASALSHGGQPGLLRTTGANTQTDAQLEFTKAKHNALPAGSSHTWSGTLAAPEAGRYWINFGELGTTGTVSIDGKTVISSDAFITGAPRYGTIKAGDAGPLPSTDGLNNKRAKVDLTVGNHELKVIQDPDVSGAAVQVHLYWVTPAQQAASRDAAVQAAKQAKTAVVFAWAERTGNMSTPLPEDQDAFIADIAAANPNTVVVLQSNAPVAMPWLDDVEGVVEAWFPGDEGGWALADLLTGRANPSGKLPFTWPANATQGVANNPDHPERMAKGVNPGTTTACTNTSAGFFDVPNCDTVYSEGVNVGYRWYDNQDLTPLYPFGYGLSYSNFSYGSVVAKQIDSKLKVTVTVTNTARRSGDEVVQVYLGAPKSKPSGVQFAKKALAAFARVHLRPGQTKRVDLEIQTRELSYWNVNTDGWTVATGSRGIYVGGSSRELPVHTLVAIR